VVSSAATTLSNTIKTPIVCLSFFHRRHQAANLAVATKKHNREEDDYFEQTKRDA